eukprot:TRINITY_DN2438_c0_g2_i1.p1 TRINITY_DN2438_c0_g2~~TRINITY_DN2438_c0_g2_i1.p1  ORF type:complete len:611 (-),score=85.83 TRINITY_DN2438_c0_g2_i1:313-2145(-)
MSVDEMDTLLDRAVREGKKTDEWNFVASLGAFPGYFGLHSGSASRLHVMAVGHDEDLEKYGLGKRTSLTYDMNESKHNLYVHHPLSTLADVRKYAKAVSDRDMSDDELRTLQCASGGRINMLQSLLNGSHQATTDEVQDITRALAQTAELQPSQRTVLQYIRGWQPASYPGDPFATAPVNINHVVAYIKAHLSGVVARPEQMIAQMVDEGFLRFSAVRYGGSDSLQIGRPLLAIDKPSSLFFSYAWGDQSALESIELLANALKVLDIPVILDRQRQNEMTAGTFNFMVDQVETADIVVMFVTENYVTKSKVPVLVSGKQLLQEQVNKMSLDELKQIPHIPDHNGVAWEVLLLGRRAAAGKRIVRILAQEMSHEAAPIPSALTRPLAYPHKGLDVANASKFILNNSQAAFEALLLYCRAGVRTHQLQVAGSKVTQPNLALLGSLQSPLQLVITGDGASTLDANEVQAALKNAITVMCPLTSDTLIVHTATREDVQKVLGGQDSLRVQVPGRVSPFDVKPRDPLNREPVKRNLLQPTLVLLGAAHVRSLAHPFACTSFFMCEATDHFEKKVHGLGYTWRTPKTARLAGFAVVKSWAMHPELRLSLDRIQKLT